MPEVKSLRWFEENMSKYFIDNHYNDSWPVVLWRGVVFSPRGDCIAYLNPRTECLLIGGISSWGRVGDDYV